MFYQRQNVVLDIDIEPRHHSSDVAASDRIPASTVTA